MISKHLATNRQSDFASAFIALLIVYFTSYVVAMATVILHRKWPTETLVGIQLMISCKVRMKVCKMCPQVFMKTCSKEAYDVQT